MFSITPIGILVKFKNSQTKLIIKFNTMLDSIKGLKENPDFRSMVVSDDGTIVIFKKQFDTETGIQKPEEVEKTFRKDEVQAEIAELQKKIDTLNAFLEKPEVATIAEVIK